MFAKSNLLVFDSSKVKDTILENIQVMVEFGVFYNRILISEDPNVKTKFEQHNIKRKDFVPVTDVSDIITTVGDLTKNVENWNTQTFIVGDMSVLEKVWDSVKKQIPETRTIIIVENGLVNLNDDFEKTLKADPRVKFNYI